MAKQKTLSSMFALVTKEEMQVSVEREFSILKTKMELEKEMEVQVVKRSVGRPRRTIDEAVLLTPKVESSTSTSRKRKVRGPYTNWFIPSLWRPIHAAVKRYKNFVSALRYLRVMHRKKGETSSVYDKLSRGSLRNWFTSQGVLREEYKHCIEDGTAYFVGGDQHGPILSKYPALEEDIITLLKSHRKAGQPLFARSMRNLIVTMIKKQEPHLLLQEGPSAFRVSLQWVRAFVRSELNWSLRKATTPASKLPNDWEQQGLRMAQRLAYLVKCFTIPPQLVVNTDQTGIHLVPTGGTRTWDEKGTKSVAVSGVDDKRQVTVSVSSSAAGEMLPFQVIFTGKSNRSLPKMNSGRRICEEAGWHITNTSNHWSNLKTCKDFVEKILQPYRAKQLEQLGLDKETPLVWIIDCWSVHKSAEFLTWLKEEHNEIKTIFVPANCTSVFQPADVILQRPFKHGFRQQFDQWSMDKIGEQLDACIKPEDIKTDYKLSTLKPLLCDWLYNAWIHIHNPSLIKRGWEQCGILRAFYANFQATAMNENITTPLFKEESRIEFEETNEDQIEEEPDTSINEVMATSLKEVSKLQKNSGASVSALKGLARAAKKRRGLTNT